jgi:hypothetical protein
MHPFHLLVDDRKAAGGSIMLLGQVFSEHAPGKFRIIPGDVFTLLPWGGDWVAVDEVSKLHTGFDNFLERVLFVQFSLIASRSILIASG